jgi:hypothetical protein
MGFGKLEQAQRQSYFFLHWKNIEAYPSIFEKLIEKKH